MAHQISTGFAAHLRTRSTDDVCDVHSAPLKTPLWVVPTLQLLDIQKLSPLCEASRYYLLLSDAVGVVYGVVPPASPLEKLLENGDVELGCVLTILEYAVVAAQNEQRVVVLLAVHCHATRFSLIGAPQINGALFVLSPAAAALLSSGTGAPCDNSAMVCTALREIWRDGAAAPKERWSVWGRVLWKGKLRRLEPISAECGGTQIAGSANTRASAGKTPRFVFECTIVDRQGDAGKAVSFGGPKQYDALFVGDCVELRDVGIRCDKEGVVSALQLDARTAIRVVAEDATIPQAAASELHGCRVACQDVRHLLATAAPGDVAAVVGVVVRNGGVAKAHTRRGLVDRRVVTLRDQLTTHRIRITIWGAFCEEPLKVGGVWCFQGVGIGVWGNELVASTTGATDIYPKEAMQGIGIDVSPMSLRMSSRIE